MTRKETDGQSGLGGTPRRQRKDCHGSIWQIKARDADFPSQLDGHPSSGEWNILHGIGNRDILRHPTLGLICSVQCPGSVIMKTFDAIRELRDAGVVVAGGFHSPMEKECLGKRSCEARLRICEYRHTLSCGSITQFLIECRQLAIESPRQLKVASIVNA